MKKKNKNIKQALKEVGAIFLRRNKHEVWKLPNGKRFTISTSSSDRNAQKEQFSLLYKLLN